MNNNTTKTIKKKNPFFYKHLINYIKNYNKDISKAKAETKIMY